MNKTIAIGCVLLVAIAACGTPSLDGPDDEPVATARSDVPATDTTVATMATGNAESMATTTTVDTSMTSTTRAPVSVTTRGPSGAAGSADPSSTTTQEGADDVESEAGGDDAVTGQVPTHLMDQVFAHAVSHTGVSASTMTVLRSESVTWPDGSLGCPEPGVQYTQALVPGYWVEIAVGDETLDYRLSEQGGMKLCENGGLVPSPREDT